MTDVSWYDLDGLPSAIDADMRRRIAAALAEDNSARFEGGR